MKHPLLIVLAIITLCYTSLQAEERAIKRIQPTETPILTIDSGGHMAKISDVIFTQDGKYLVSASNDKTIRVWDVETGDIVRVLRGQIGEGHEGKIYAAALSPDNRWLAVGGWTHPECAGRCGNIRLLNYRTGELTRLLKGHGNVVLGLAFSPDSTRLISGSFDKPPASGMCPPGNPCIR